MDAFHRLSRFGSLMLRARALGVALLIAIVGFGGGICVAFVCASWNDVPYLQKSTPQSGMLSTTCHSFSTMQ